MKPSRLLGTVCLLSCAAPVPTSSNPGVTMAPNKYAFGNPVTYIGSQGNYQVITESYQVQDWQSGVRIPGAVAHFRVTRGFLTPAPRMVADSAGRLTLTWSESFPIVQMDTLFGCAVDPGFDCVPTFPVFVVGPGSAP